VLVELVIAGRHRRGADVLLARYAASPELTLISAAHGLIEAMSAVRRLTQRDVLRPEDGLAAVEWLGELDVVLDATAPRMRRIWSLRELMRAYDAVYAAAAEHSQRRCSPSTKACCVPAPTPRSPPCTSTTSARPTERGELVLTPYA